MFRFIITFISVILLTGCTNLINKENNLHYEEIECICPPTIYLQPVNNFTENEAKTLIPKINKVLEESTGVELDIIVLSPKKLPDSLLNDSKTRYRADKIIKTSKDNNHDVTIIITHDDISCSYKGIKDWGILGFALYPKHTCIASDFRLKNKERDFYKVIIHEFCHSYFGLKHCPDDNPQCIMKDAKGHADFSNKFKLCNTCKNRLTK